MLMVMDPILQLVKIGIFGLLFVVFWRQVLFIEILLESCFDSCVVLSTVSSSWIFATYLSDQNRLAFHHVV